MCDIWKNQQPKPVRLLAVGLGERGRQAAEEGRRQMPVVPFYMPNGKGNLTDSLIGADVIYLVAGVEESATVARISEWARQKRIPVLWSPGRLKNARLMPLPGSVILQSGLSIVQEWKALEELFCSSNATATLDREALLRKLQSASQADVALVLVGKERKEQDVAHQLAAQGWQTPKEGTLAVSIGVSMNCRLEEVVNLWNRMVNQTVCKNVLWGTSFSMEESDITQLVLLAVKP